MKLLEPLEKKAFVNRIVSQTYKWANQGTIIQMQNKLS